MNTAISILDGKSVSALGQGTWYMGDDPRKRTDEIKALRTGIDLGMEVIDTAEMYGDGRSEVLVGEAIAGRRDKVFLISKVLPSNASRKGTKAACENSLKRLGTDTLDMYLLHWQGRYPFAETVEAMLELVKEGKIRSWGVSNMDVPEMEEFYSISGGNTCAANEVLYNLSRRGIEFDLIPWCGKKKLPIIAYSPIEQGRVLDNSALRELGEKHGVTPAQITLAWVLRMPGVLAIPKAGSPGHVEENFGALSVSLTEDDMEILDENFPAPGRKVPLEML
ncbi:aldo/keto reductase [Breznakiella homolactica]|uniref:Aldo/keto reductase n=1 Tax=Breznakiella homolactica TaxID=2798577 RepID=A0A7T8BA02_9SPIR|nr:aldo/keto reductase [Breznakiella homolactica]QQO08465.1 aldo/keto reductase [Breznakiella homolactica]